MLHNDTIIAAFSLVGLASYLYVLNEYIKNRWSDPKNKPIRIAFIPLLFLVSCLMPAALVYFFIHTFVR